MTWMYQNIMGHRLFVIVLVLTCSCFFSFSVCVDALTAKGSNVDLQQLSTRVVINFIDGTIGGLLDEKRGNFSLLETSVFSNCSSEDGKSELLLLLDQTMLSFYTTDKDYGLDTLTKGLTTLSQIIADDFIPMLQNCNASVNITSALSSAALTLTALDSVNGTMAELMINKVEVYSEMATALGYWTRSNFYEAGVYLGVVLQKTSKMTNSTVHFCDPLPSVLNSRMWEKFYTSLGEQVHLHSDEKIIPPLNFPGSWDWCWVQTKPNQSYPGTYICDPTNGIFGEGQFTYLNQLINFTTGSTDYDSYFDDAYYDYLNDIPWNYNLTDPSEWSLWNQALAAYNNKSYYADYVAWDQQIWNGTLWNTSTTAMDYVQTYINNTQNDASAPWLFSSNGVANYMEFCSGNPGEMELGNIYQDFNKTFIQGLRNGTWHDIEVDFLHSNFSLLITGMNLMRVNVTVGKWFMPEILNTFNKQLNSYMDSMITGVIVASKVRGHTEFYSGTKSAYNDFWSPGQSFTFDGLRLGSVFSLGYSAEVGSESIKATMSSGSEYSDVVPYIIGFIIRKLPFES